MPVGITLLPSEAADVIARLKREGTEDFDKVKSKSSLLKKYTLSAKVFWWKFQESEKGTTESCTEFAYKLTSDLQK